ncbi:MAG: hypothetical protein HQL46_13325 [Gammaproteobacteria bacterium]|nr:hypothetical protein [Gammaproteobacteria bacterium]
MNPHARDAEMLQHIKSWQDSGETQANYCKRHGLAQHQLIYYRQKLGFMKPVQSTLTRNQLVPVTIKPEKPASEPIWIEHDNGFKIQFSSDICVEQFNQALTLIKAVS